MILTVKSLNAQLEIPKFSEDMEIISYRGFTLSYSEEHEQPWWVAYELDINKLSGSIKRSNRFRIDPKVDKGSANLSDYKKSGFDRGHLAPAADMKWSKVAMDDSFLMSNISPQVPGFNRGIWKKLESVVRRWTNDNEKIYVVTGPVLINKYSTIGSNNVSVPNFFYKVIFDNKGPEKKGIGFVLPNEKSTNNLKDFSMNIDSVESITGIDFFYLLEDSFEDSLERSLDLSQWGLE
jgi:endonuclease G, mitochondrial